MPEVCRELLPQRRPGVCRAALRLSLIHIKMCIRDRLNQLWELTSLQVNLFLPQQKLISKTRTGATVRKKHDHPTTPLHRLLNHHADLCLLYTSRCV